MHLGNLGGLRNFGNLGNLGKLLGTLGTSRGFGTVLGNLSREPFGNLGNLGGMGFGAAPVCSETFTMAENPIAHAAGEK